MHYITAMDAQRTTVAIEADVLREARQIARQSHRTLGAVVSDLMRQSLRPPPVERTRKGIRLLPVYNPNAVVTIDHVNELRDEAP